MNTTYSIYPANQTSAVASLKAVIKADCAHSALRTWLKGIQHILTPEQYIKSDYQPFDIVIESEDGTVWFRFQIKAVAAWEPLFLIDASRERKGEKS